MRKDFASGASHQHVVFNTDTAPIGQINTRFDRHNHSRLENSLVLNGKPRRFVDQEAQAVPQPVAKTPPETGIGDERPGYVIDIVSHNPRLNHSDSPGLGFQYHMVDPLKLRRDSTGHKHPRKVASVEAFVCPPIDQNEPPLANPLLRGRSMGQCSPGTDGHNRGECRVFGPEQPPLVF